MGNRGQKRVETVEDLPPPADKRACNSPQENNRPSTSGSSSVHAQDNSSEFNDRDGMETPSSQYSEGDPNEESKSVYGSCDSDETVQGQNDTGEQQRQRSSSQHDQFRGILESIGKLTDASEKLVFLTELCETLSFCNEDSISTKTADTLSPNLVKFARDEMIPDIVLLAIRAMTYLCDLFPRSSGFLIRDDAVPVLCQKLMAIDDMDVAEQCLQALEKISREQPLACLQAGAIMAALSYLDFFSTSIQRVALSTVLNICRKLPSESTAPFMDAVPFLCNLLQYEDTKLVEIVAACLIKITERVRQSPLLLDELCNHGLIQRAFDLLTSSYQITLPQHVLNGLLGLLAKLSSGSFTAFKILYELDISSVVKNILSTLDIVDGQCNQMYGVLKLLDSLLPYPVSGQNSSESSEKDIYLRSQTELLQNLGMDTLPMLIQMANSGANTYACYGGLSIAKKLIHWGKPDSLVDSLKSANISSFLASVFTKKDQHFLFLALQTIELILEKLPDEFLHSFVKEGVFFSIDALVVPEKCPEVTSEPSSGSQAPNNLNQKNTRCLCYSFAFGTEINSCKLEKEAVNNLAKHIIGRYFPSELINSDKSFTGVLSELKALSKALSYMTVNNDASDEDHEKYYSVLYQIITKLNGKDQISTFEFIESGIIKSFVQFLNGGLNLKRHRNCRADHDDSLSLMGKRVEVFQRLFLLSSDPTAMSQDLPLSTLIRKLQNALSNSETFPVILNNASRTKETHSDNQDGHYMRFSFLRVRLLRGEGEENLQDYHKSYMAINPLSTLSSIEGFLWPKVNKQAQKHTEEAGSSKSDVAMTEASEVKAVTEERLQSASSKLVFFHDGQQLDPKLTLYQALLQKQMKLDENFTVSKAWWGQGYTLTYRIAEIQPENLEGCSCFVQKPNENSSPIDDILHFLNLVNDTNKIISALICDYKLNLFAEGKLDDLGAIITAVPTIPQTEFVNNKLTEKLEQQMRDPLALTIGGIPTWCTKLVNLSPHLFSFEARSKYFRLAAFGSSQILPHQQPASSVGVSRKKYSVSRSKVLESAAAVMEKLAGKNATLEVEYKDEVGTGLGPTLEFYTLVSHELQKTGMQLWRDDLESFSSQFITSPLGLFPRPWSSSTETVRGVGFSDVCKKFTLLGQIVAKALQDGRVLDLSLSKAFYKLILGQELALYDILSFDPGLGRTLLEFMALVNRKLYLESTRREISFLEYESCFRGTRIEDLCLDFTLPGYPEYLLGSSELQQATVTMSNLHEYILLVLDATLRSGISKQVEAFKSGFNQVFSIGHLQIFTEDELERLLCGERESWTVNELLDHVKFDHGYTSSSTPMIHLMEIIREFGKKERRAFLQFVTGTPRLPLGGFASLNPKLTIVRKCTVGSVDSDLPSVMTCANYLKLPPYSSKETMREKLVYAITEGQGSFHLS